MLRLAKEESVNKSTYARDLQWDLAGNSERNQAASQRRCVPAVVCSD